MVIMYRLVIQIDRFRRLGQYILAISVEDDNESTIRIQSQRR